MSKTNTPLTVSDRAQTRKQAAEEAHDDIIMYYNVLCGLTTSILDYEGPDGHRMSFRALIDPVAESSFIMQHVAQSLRLPGKTVHVSVTGVGGQIAEVATREVQCTLRSKVEGNFSLPVQPCTQNPRQPVAFHSNRKEDLEPPSGFSSLIHSIRRQVPANVCAAILQPQLRRGPPNTPIAQVSSLE